MSRKIKISENEYYHIYNRGVDKRIIFSDVRDYERFVCLLFISNSQNNFELSKHSHDEWSLEKIIKMDRGQRLVSIGVWCLMPNHFHILIKENVEGGISLFMQKLSTAYTMYFNKKYKRSGALFAGTFKAKHIDSDIYLKYSYSYIHLNSIAIIDKGWKNKKIENIFKAKKFVKEFKYSSYMDYLGEERLENQILNREEFPKYFENVKKFDKMMDFWMENSEESFRI